MRELIEQLKSIIATAGQIAIAKKQQGLEIFYKSDNSPVTNADKEISNFISLRLKKLTPDIAVICEEQPKDIAITNGTFWLIDPIDGTRSYIKGEATYTVNIGLIDNFRPSFGMIYQPELYKLYYTDHLGNLAIEIAAEGNDFQDDPLFIRQEMLKQEEDSDIIYKAVVGHHHYNNATKEFLQKHAVTKISAIPSSIKLCLIAEGKGDIYPRFGQTMEWDIAAGHAIINSAGGNIVDSNGNNIIYGKPDFSNPDFFACSNRWKMMQRSQKTNNLI